MFRNRTNISRNGKGFLRDRRGLSAVEFALLAPMMITLYMGSVELCNAMLTDRKVTSVASLVADLVAQEQSMTNEDIEAIFAAAEAIIAPFNAAPLELVVTSIVGDEDGDAEVDWSEAYHTSPRPEGAGINLPDGLVEAGQSVVMTEVRYTFTSPLGYIMTGTRTFEDKFYLRPRRTVQITRVP